MRFVYSLSKSITILACVAVLVISSFVFSSPAQAENHEVTMGKSGGKGLIYIPKKTTAKAGDTVTFIVGEQGPHNVIFNKKKMPYGKKEAKKIAKALTHKKLEQKGEFTIEIPSDAKAGDYEFFCTPHKAAGMVGHIIVE